MHPQDLRETLARNVRAHAEGKGIALNELAKEAGISRGTMHYLATSQTSTGLDVIAKIADALGVAPSELLRP